MVEKLDEKFFNGLIDEINRIKGLRELGLVSDLYIESIIVHLIEKKFPNEVKFRYHTRLDILVGFDIISKEFAKDIRAFHEIRNLFAHSLDVRSKEFEQKLSEQIHRVRLDIIFTDGKFDSVPIYPLMSITALSLMRRLYDAYEKI